MGAPEDEHIFGIQLRESADDGSDFTNADADYRKVFLGEDGQLHAKDSAGAVTALGGSGGVTVEDEGTPLATTATTLDFVGAGVTASGTGASKTITIPGGSGSPPLEQHTASTSATLDFTTFIDAAYDVYDFVFANIVPDTGDVGFRMRMGTGGGPTYDTGNNYGWATHVYRAGGAAQAGAEGGVAFSQLTFGSGGGAGIATTANWPGYNGTLRLYLPSSAVFKVSEGSGTYFDGTFRSAVVLRASYESTTAVTAVRFYMSTGNIASGSIYVYGREN